MQEIIQRFTQTETTKVRQRKICIVFFVEYYTTMLNTYYEYSPLPRLLGITDNTNPQIVVMLGMAATIAGMPLYSDSHRN